MPLLSTEPLPTATRCQACGEDIRWVWHVGRGRKIALDVDPHEQGTVICGPGDAAGLAMDIPLAVLLTWEIQDRREETPRWRAHRERCGMQELPRRLGDSQTRWARGDTRGSRRLAANAAAPVALEHVEPRPPAWCDGCGQRCAWGTAADGTHVLVDIDPSLTGLLVWVFPADPSDQRVETAGLRRDPTDSRARFSNHHLTCRRRTGRPSTPQIRRMGRGWSDPAEALRRLEQHRPTSAS